MLLACFYAFLLNYVTGYWVVVESCSSKNDVSKIHMLIS